MSIFLYDRVRETSTTTGTGNLTLSGVAASGGYRRFQGAVPSGALIPYVIQNPSAGEWEVGVGLFSSPTTLVRTYVNASSNSGNAVNFSAGTKDVWIDVPATMAKPNPTNYLINDFSLWQRVAALNNVGSLSLLTVAADSYGPDRWRCHRENADLQYSRQSTTPPGPQTQYYGQFKKVTNAGKILICQPIENAVSVGLSEWVVCFQCNLWGNSNRTLKIALVEWDGTGDGLTAAMVSSWNANGTDPTLATNYGVIAQATVSATTSPQIFAVSGTSGSSMTNLLAVVWSDSQLSANDSVYMSEPALYLGQGPQPYVPIPIQQTVRDCQRFAYFINPTSNAAGRIALGYLQSGTLLEFMFPFPVAMRGEPTLTHNVSAWASANPTGTQAASFNPSASAFTTITGSLTVAAFCPSPTQSGLRLTAGTSFSGTNGNVVDLRIGSSVLLGWIAEI